MSANKRIQLFSKHFTSSAQKKGQPNEMDIFLDSPPDDLHYEYQKVFTAEAASFVAELIIEFENEINEVLILRQQRQLDFESNRRLPNFLPHTDHIRKSNWKVSPVPAILQDRRVDIGSISPSKTNAFIDALYSGAQGVQADLDDGHCPSWRNTILALYNLQQASLGQLRSQPHVTRPASALIIVRPRAFNMVEQNMMVNGITPLGALFDFGFHMFHSGKCLFNQGRGPFFYLPKLESYVEARLWSRIFTWTERRLDIPHGTIKSIVLIENICAAFEMDEILYELRHHSAGLNCGMWDYAASFISKFRSFPDYLLPDRAKYVSMDCRFMKSYMKLLITTCHRRGAHATTGMVPFLLNNCADKDTLKERICKSKYNEAICGSDGALVFDLALVSLVQEVFKGVFQDRGCYKNQISHKFVDEPTISAGELLETPKGDVTLEGLKLNVNVGVRFVYAWLNGDGTFVFNGSAEDSATAEISRSQVWQWLRYRCYLKDVGKRITTRIVYDMVQEVIQQLNSEQISKSTRPFKAGRLFWNVVTARTFDDFITSYLYRQQSFLDENN